MSAVGAYPVLANLRREAGLGDLDRQLLVLPGKLRWLAWMCAAQLALIILLDLLVFFPEVFS